MTYCTQQDLIDRFGSEELVQRTDRTNIPPTTIDDTVVTRALGDAEAMVDGYLAKAYALPLVTVPPVLTKITADIARFYLWGEAADKDSPVERAYRDAQDWLQDVATGTVVLDNAGTEPESSGGNEVVTNDPERVFTACSMKDYI